MNVRRVAYRQEQAFSSIECMRARFAGNGEGRHFHGAEEAAEKG